MEDPDESDPAGYLGGGCNMYVHTCKHTLYLKLGSQNPLRIRVTGSGSQLYSLLDSIQIYLAQFPEVELGDLKYPGRFPGSRRLGR